MSECIFCKIVKKEIPADIVYENDRVVAFKNINPVAPVHVLIIPKFHIPSLNHLGLEDKTLMGELILVAQKIAREQGVDKSGYRLVLNMGKDAGQTVDHLHLHLIGGEKLPWA
ncbi:MAG: histidine triad nucleotide-binding protein [Candidatus Nealsonbacteria bacterium CG02_land_8_20_14_3_00_37_10]|uniref:Histidine triad nucleotide-binding protein n=2 Tax=Candidatus Nealsoniibacteriota TaxID=1817911 RepID=A0A2G9YY27_9BACT|nr:MAG: histidine triad nucleotide-binding protein [Candidatus Nealsonbacteria bacterium CG23_combo_of_CG06-09_8_20_14_all_37_18]PIV45129.1 MAG: histidine triad nucleotide-binding protein [Candidatus Nealsonbacteria bacterium CG02_land_8_20_14_3_00_37_10]